MHVFGIFGFMFGMVGFVLAGQALARIAKLEQRLNEIDERDQ